MEKKRTRAPRETSKEVPNHQQSSQSEACLAVFYTPELLEAILLHCDVRTILVSAQRVCVLWRNAITASPKLQRRLFFLLDQSPNPLDYPDHEILAATPTSTIPFPPPHFQILNPLLRWAFTPLFPDPSSAPATASTQLARELQSLHYNPANPLGLGDYPADFVRVPGLSARSPDADMRMTDVGEHRWRHRAFTRAGASWRRMVLTQPPLRRIARAGMLTEEERGHGPLRDWYGPDERRGRMVVFEEGLRMGPLLDEVWGITWGRKGRWAEQPWAYVTWKVPGLGVPEALLNAGSEVARRRKWVGEADLVVQERVSLSLREWSCDGHKPKREGKCRLRSGNVYMKRRWASMKWVYRCEEYTPDGPLSLEGTQGAQVSRSKEGINFG